MLAKLIKYNLKPIFKSILPFVILLLFSIILFNVTAYEVEYTFNEQGNLVDIMPPEIQQFLHGLANFIISCSLILLLASAVRAIWHRFKTSFYSDEAYLTHTLPISRRTLWNAQIYSTIITFISIIALLVLGCLLLTLTHNGQQLLESFGLIGGCSRCVGEYYYIEPLSLGHYLSYTFAIFIELLFITLCGFSGIILGNRFSKNISLISGVCIYLVGSFIILALLYITSNLDSLQGPSIGTPGSNADFGTITNVLLYAGVIYSCYCLILYFVDQKLLDRSINLD